MTGSEIIVTIVTIVTGPTLEIPEKRQDGHLAR